MAFLFKSKKHQDRALAGRDGNSGSQGSIQSAGARAAEKSTTQHRATPTGSLNSIDNEGSAGSPDRGPVHGRRGGSVDQTPSHGPSQSQSQIQAQAPNQNQSQSQAQGPIHAQGHAQGHAQQPSADLPLRNGPQMNGPNASLYPWSQRRLTYTSSHPSPFPRYGAAVNSISSKEGDIYLMGGLINGSTVKGDLWMIEAGGNMACYPLATTAEGPGPRVGHSSLLVGNAFIVYGGDTKIEESDVLDETLYLLNTSTRQWSRALPSGTRPSGRYGHSLNILGSKIFIFGGQVEGFFMNDLSAFDLNQLQMANNRWEILVNGESSQKVPAARTNHTMITYNDKMYLFGGTNGFQWFNDVWCYDPIPNKWAQLDCIGYIPAPREGHAAALVDDVMYIFGGRTEEGTDLGDLAAFRISSRRWYTFQNMGPSPSPRSGHSMTAVGKSVVVLGGEPSTASTTVNDLGILYVLDTSKIRYPNDAQQGAQGAQGAQRLPQGRRPSASEGGPTARHMPPREGSNGPSDARRMIGGPTGPSNGFKPPPNGADPNGPPPGPHGPPGARIPRGAAGTPPAGPPPQGPMPAKPTVDTSAMGRIRGPSAERIAMAGSPKVSNQSPITREVINETDSPVSNGRRTPTQQLAKAPPRGETPRVETPRVETPRVETSRVETPRVETPRVETPRADTSRVETPKGENPNGEALKNKPLRIPRSQGSIDNSNEPALKPASPRATSPPPPARQPGNLLSRRSSARNSQTVVLLKELDSARNRNAWYASELELARKAGYAPNASMSPMLDGKATETFDDEDRPLIEALLAMRTELANVQTAVDKQAVIAAKQIAEAEAQRDAAIQEAVYAKAKLAAHRGGSAASTPQLEHERDESDNRSSEFGRKLALALHLQNELQTKLDSTKSDLEAEKRARKLADDTTNAAQKRMTDLETYKQQTSTEVERLKAELHVAQREAREQSVSCAEAVAAMELLKVEKEDLEEKYEEVVGNSREHSDTFESLRSAIVSSEDSRNHFESKLMEERDQREELESQLNKLKFEYEARTAELVSATQRLRDAEELAEKHAAEARTHRQAVLAGLDKISARDVANPDNMDTGRMAALQEQVTASNALVKKYQQEADTAADKLRSAEERIAGLEQYQEQSSREGVGIRRQLQSALRETQSLQAANSDLKNRLAAQQLETNAMTVQHNALKDILSERGISPTGAIRARGLTSPRTNSPELGLGRARELEAQLASANAAHEETKQAFAIQAQESESAYREKLSQLESDYQSAVHYVKGTEKMLKQLKDQLGRYKTENSRLKSEVEELEDKLNSDGPKSPAPGNWDMERSELQRKVEGLEDELRDSGSNLEKSLEALKAELMESNRARDEALRSHEQASRELESQRKDLEQLQSENALLEQRASDAEQKVALLLDQVEHSVDSYRRRSRQVPSMNSEMLVQANGLGLGHMRTESSEGESIYGGNGTNSLDARNSAALDNLASELETLRTHWEATNKNYRLSTNFDFDTATSGKKEDDSATGIGLSESLADWRKRLDTDEHHSDGEKPRRA